MDKSFLNHLKSKYQNQEQERDLITLSVRVSAEENAAIQDLADTVGCTRQDVLYELIKKYALSEWAVLRKEELEAESNIEDISVDGHSKGSTYFLLNTNKANSVADHQFMIENGIAAAFEDGYMQKINKIHKGDTVFLYESGVGIIAHGLATGETLKKEHNGVKDKTHYQKLDNFKILDKPLPAKKICFRLERKIPFVQTLIKLRDGEKLLK
jgi:exoribonuclease R